MDINIKYVIENADALWGTIRWANGVYCPKCGCVEYYNSKDGRYICKGCNYIYSETTNTILQNSKLKKWQWLVAMYSLVTNKSISVRELSSTIGVTVVTAWRMQQKLRMYMSMEEVDCSGIVKMDEAHIGGWGGMHLKKKIEYMRKNNFMLPQDTRYTKKQILAASSNKKHHIISIINEENKCVIKQIKGQITRGIIKQIVKQYNITHIISDESKIYQNIKGVTCEQSNHSKHIFMTEGGYTSNACENRFSWVKRILNGYHSTASEKYLQLYLNQFSFKFNNKDLTIKDRLIKLGILCCKKYISSLDVYNYDYTEDFEYPIDNNHNLVNLYLSNPLIQTVKIKSRIYTK
jgi:transposase-like protein